MTPPDDILENETDDRPRDIVLSGRRRNETSSIEDDWYAVHMGQYNTYHVKEGCAYLMYLAKLFGYFFVSAQGMMGAIAPTRKKNMSALWGIR